MRKYYVSLLVVDQRPSGIDPEIISQIGTKIVAQLNDEKDIQAVLTGVSNATSIAHRFLLHLIQKNKHCCLVMPLLCRWLCKHVNMMNSFIVLWRLRLLLSKLMLRSKNYFDSLHTTRITIILNATQE